MPSNKKTVPKALWRGTGARDSAAGLCRPGHKLSSQKLNLNLIKKQAGMRTTLVTMTTKKIKFSTECGSPVPSSHLMIAWDLLMPLWLVTEYEGCFCCPDNKDLHLPGHSARSETEAGQSLQDKGRFGFLISRGSRITVQGVWWLLRRADGVLEYSKVSGNSYWCLYIFSSYCFQIQEESNSLGLPTLIPSSFLTTLLSIFVESALGGPLFCAFHTVTLGSMVEYK